jgi:hypothetical protein
MRIVIGVKRLRARKRIDVGDYTRRKVQAYEYRFFGDGFNDFSDVGVWKQSRMRLLLRPNTAIRKSSHASIGQTYSSEPA